jgi:methyl-accepting chemotaxis protein
VVELARPDARARGGGAGLFNVISVVILVVGVVIIGITAALLARTLAAAQSIDDKAQAIAKNAGNINVATDSVVSLNRTNELATSILQSAKPLQGQLNTVAATARDIDDVAKSINETAETINTTAGTINHTAGTINDTARDIATSVDTISRTAGTIDNTTGNIAANVETQ